VRLGDRGHLLVESTLIPFMESAAALLAGGLALPEDEIVMKFSGSVFEIRRGRINDAVKNAVGRSPMRLIQGRTGVRAKTHPRASRAIDGIARGGGGPRCAVPMRQVRFHDDGAGFASLWPGGLRSAREACRAAARSGGKGLAGLGRAISAS
jgi:hypothetical protein